MTAIWWEWIVFGVAVYLGGGFVTLQYNFYLVRNAMMVRSSILIRNAVLWPIFLPLLIYSRIKYGDK